MAKFCENCGSELKEGQVLCLNCGKYINGAEDNNATNGTSDNNTESPADKKANTGFILGLVSIIAWFIPLFGYPVTICGIIFSAKGLESEKNKTKAMTGLILSIIFVVVTLINSILGVLLSI